MKRKIFGILFTLVLVLSFSLIPAVPAMAADPGDVTIVAQDQAGNPIEGATVKVFWGVNAWEWMTGKTTDASGSATFTADEISTWMGTHADPDPTLFQVTAKYETDGACGNVYTHAVSDGMPCITYNASTAYTFTYTLVMFQKQEPTIVSESGNITATFALAEPLTLTGVTTKMGFFRSAHEGEPTGGQIFVAFPDGQGGWDKYVMLGEDYLLATVDGTSFSATGSASLFDSVVVEDDEVIAVPWVVKTPVVHEGLTGDEENAAEDIYGMCSSSWFPYLLVLPVEIEGDTCFYPTIQDAIDASTASDTITVAAGTYTEQINITKSMTITGSGTSDCHIVCPTAANMTVYRLYSTDTTYGTYGRYSGHRGANAPIVRIAASDVTFQGFHINFNTVDLRDTVDSYSRGVGILVDHVESTPGTPATLETYTGITIQNNKIDGMLQDTDHVGIKALGNATVSVLNNTIYGYGESAISAQGVDAPARAAYYPTVTANSNTIYGGNFERSGFDFMGIGYWSGGAGSADGNTIYNAPNDKGYALATWTPNPVSFTNNTVTTEGGSMGAGCGAQLIESSALTVSGNTFEKQFLAGWLWSNPTAEITNNTITDCTNGFVADDLTSGSVALHYNDFSNTADYAVDFNGQMTPAHGWTAHACTITANATNNWWGSAAGPYHVTTNPGDTAKMGDAVSDNVDYAPWLYLTTAANGGDTVANIVANEVPAYAQSVVLSGSWNTFSVPIGLDGQYNTWAELYTLTNLDYSVAYRFNPTTQQFVALATTTEYAIAPGEGFYIKMNSAGNIPYCYSTQFTIPSRDLKAGWDLIGGGMEARSEVGSCISIATTGSTAGYTHIISPQENASSWVYIAEAAAAHDFVPGEGYWVFMAGDRTLGLFDPTPVAWVAP